jgi:hypothetical protein
VTLAADATGVEYRLLTAENVVEVSSFEKSWSFSPDELVVEGQGGMLYYDITRCRGNPWDLPALHAYNCSCTHWNVVVDTTGFTSPVSVLPTYGWSPDGGANWYIFQWGSPASLDPGYFWYLSTEVPLQGSGIVGNFLYAAGVEYQGQLYVNFVQYNVSVNCPQR